MPSMGGVLHTLNCSLSAEHVAYIINHAGDRFLISTAVSLEAFLPVLPLIPTVECLIVRETGRQLRLVDDRGGVL